MTLADKVALLAKVIHWRLTWGRHDSEYRSGIKNPKFVTAREAMALVPDGAVCISSGMAGNARCSIQYWALKERWLREGRPRGLTWIAVGGQGGRGRAPGTIEEIAIPGLLSRGIMGHIETANAWKRLAEQGYLELHNLPQGQMTYLIEAQARGEDSVVSRVGVGTYLDPRSGRGSVVCGDPRNSLVSVEGDLLRYRLPRIQVAVFNVPYADEKGNLYVRNAACLTETLESALAAKANGGIVIASVGDVIEEAPDEVFIPADKVDAIILNPDNEQTGATPQRKYWDFLTPHSSISEVEGVARLKFVCNVLGITPRRGPVDDAVARLAATVFTRTTPPGSLVNIGVGMPEEVCRVVFEAGLTRDVTFMTETGVVGGLPAPGIFFGAAVNPKRQITSAQVFHLCQKELATSILGVLQADSLGNVNVSRRGPGPRNYVGCGGLPDLVDSARTIIFVGSFMAHARFDLVDGQIRIVRRGVPKFVDRVDEVTFSGPQALAHGKDVWYVTQVGVFRLTEAGMVLVQVMPGIDVRKDIIEGTPMKVVVPDEVAVVDRAVLTGKGFELAWALTSTGDAPQPPRGGGTAVGAA